MEDTVDLFADVNEMNSILENCEADSIEVLYQTNMVFPVLGCIGITFPSKAKFTRHWEEKKSLTVQQVSLFSKRV